MGFVFQEILDLNRHSKFFSKQGRYNNGMFLCWKGGDSIHFCFVLCDPKYGLIIFLIEFKLLPKSADHFIHGDVDYGLLDALR